MPELSSTIYKWLQPSEARGLCENFSERIVQRHTRKDTAQAVVQLFGEGLQRETDDFGETEGALFRPIFCRRYEPETGVLKSCVYRLGMDRYDDLETALAEVLAEGHTSAEMALVLKHFQRVGNSYDD